MNRESQPRYPAAVREKRGLAAGLTEQLLERLSPHFDELARKPPGSDPVLQMAQQHGFLPLVADMGGVAGLMPDGTVVEMVWDDERPQPVGSLRWQDVVLLVGAKRYPELLVLIPARPRGAEACANCGGTGTFMAGDKKIADIICSCGGLGWIPDWWER
jgi:hypothetical protein